jgi:FtsZ-binding cell division protein ZapB
MGIKSHSIITGDNGPNATQLATGNLRVKNADLFRQLLNQETIIRLGQERTLQDLKKEMITMKQSIETANQKASSVTDLQREMEKLKQENQRLQTENLAMNKSIETASQKANSVTYLQREIEQLKQENQRIQAENIAMNKSIEAISEKTNLEIGKLNTK